jgi:hypothetical protein
MTKTHLRTLSGPPSHPPTHPTNLSTSHPSHPPLPLSLVQQRIELKDASGVQHNSVIPRRIALGVIVGLLVGGMPMASNAVQVGLRIIPSTRDAIDGSKPIHAAQKAWDSTKSHPIPYLTEPKSFRNMRGSTTPLEGEKQPKKQIHQKKNAFSSRCPRIRTTFRIVCVRVSTKLGS